MKVVDFIVPFTTKYALFVNKLFRNSTSEVLINVGVVDVL